MGLYDTFRKDGGPTLYPSNKTAVTADVLEAGFLFAIAIVGFSFLIVMPGVRGKQRIFFLFRWVIGLFVLGSIMICNFGQEWEVAHIHSRTQYKAGISKEIDADIGVKIGLRSMNITLKTDPVVQNLTEHQSETINYNERFRWDDAGWVQGRFGFGPFAGLVNREFREAQFKGLPYPILWIAEYLTLDGEGIRWGRHYRQAGYYTHICMWFAFPMWILSMIFFHMVIPYGAVSSMLTGFSMLMGNIIYATVRNANQLEIPFRDDHLVFSWGWCFWLCLFNGIFLLVLGFVIQLMDIFFPEHIEGFFGQDESQGLEEIYDYGPNVGMEVRVSKPQHDGRNGSAATAAEAIPERSDLDEGDGESDDSDNIYENPHEIKRVYKRRGTTFVTKPLYKNKKSTIRKRRPVPEPRRGRNEAPSVDPQQVEMEPVSRLHHHQESVDEEDDDQDFYENVDPKAKKNGTGPKPELRNQSDARL